ncbi:hypothetical protein [Streptomyces sp. JJ36]|uniref:hypothetical protein n=1 Tax=Streptomyces sp. JJ36 TaxID=2736645 RepID=UPI001F3D1AF0|nr:hypothetical protein [Streptomyces sp. JJ36]MCF6524079.1 hypothetical protein [Streptomyces sp. JJ36]
MYKLRYEKAAEVVWDSLPDDARTELDRALIAVCEDPYGTTEPAGEDGDVKRILTLRYTMCVLVAIQPPIQRVRILHISYLG